MTSFLLYIVLGCLSVNYGFSKDIIPRRSCKDTLTKYLSNGLQLILFAKMEAFCADTEPSGSPNTNGDADILRNSKIQQNGMTSWVKNMNDLSKHKGIFKHMIKKRSAADSILIGGKVLAKTVKKETRSNNIHSSPNRRTIKSNRQRGINITQRLGISSDARRPKSKSKISSRNRLPSVANEQTSNNLRVISELEDQRVNARKAERSRNTKKSSKRVSLTRAQLLSLLRRHIKLLSSSGFKVIGFMPWNSVQRQRARPFSRNHEVVGGVLSVI